MIVEFKQKSQVTIPHDIVKVLGLKTGDPLEVYVKNGKIQITPVAIIPKDQLWFYDAEWQKEEKKVDEEIKKGKIGVARNPKKLFQDLGI